MDFDQHISKIKTAFRNPLPGEAGQRLMAPQLRKTTQELLEQGSIYKMSSVMILLFPDYNGNLTTLFIERPINNSVHSGQIAFPGGKVEDFDLTPAHAALRETEEEVGVSASSIELIGTLTSLVIPASNFIVHPHVGALNYTPDFIPSPEEVQSLIHVNINELLTIIPSTKQFSTRYGNLSAPCFTLKNHDVWGATAMMVSEFREMMGKGKG